MRRAALLTIALTGVLTAPAVAQDTTASGPAIFTAQKCSLCHSIGGKGNVKGPLDDVGAKSSPDDIRAWLTDAKAMTAKTKAPRKPEMKAYTMTKLEVDTLVTYLSGMKTK
jgi:mono/diheme cytochrome c family protein